MGCLCAQRRSRLAGETGYVIVAVLAWRREDGRGRWSLLALLMRDVWPLLVPKLPRSGADPCALLPPLPSAADAKPEPFRKHHRSSSCDETSASNETTNRNRCHNTKRQSLHPLRSPKHLRSPWIRSTSPPPTPRLLLCSRSVKKPLSQTPASSSRYASHIHFAIAAATYPHSFFFFFSYLNISESARWIAKVLHSQFRVRIRN